jgi:hypothetical protein
MLFDGLVPGGGFGSTPFGTYFGAGSGGTWGLFAEPFRSSQLEVTCESCSRVRSQKRLGGAAVFGGFISDGYFYVVASDVLLPATCYSLRIEGPSGTFLVQLEYDTGTPPPIYAPTPVTTAPSPPPGALLVDTLLRARLPEVPETGSYTMTVVDRCCGCETAVATVTLEAPAMILTPFDADIGGAPRSWLRGSRLTLDPGQPTGSARPSIPFDKCRVVLEYDPREQVLPDAQGWVRSGSGAAADWSLTPNGDLRLDTTAPNDNYYEKTVAINPAPTTVYMYSSVLSEDIPNGAPGSGFDTSALYAAAGSPYSGVRTDVRNNQVFYTAVDGSTEFGFTTPQAPPQWQTSGAANALGGKDISYERNAFDDLSSLITPTFGTVGLAASDEFVARFGNRDGTVSLVAYLRDFVASDGRFIRARFVSYAPVTSPVLRLYVVSDSNGSAQKTVRFKVRYGSGSGAPGGPLPQVASATVNMLVANVVYEVPISLSGLTANSPMWLSVERDWLHGDDKLEATAHLIQASVRAL